MKICLDAGHYGNYNQGIVKSYYEAKMVWELTNLQKKYFEQYEGVQVILTRSNQASDMAIYDRGMKAKGCKLFISNHSNACGTESVDYPVVIRAYDNKNNADALGIKLAKKMAEIMGTRQGGRTFTKKGPNGEYYGVLRGARAAGAEHYFIVEHSFHSNKKACNWLLNKANLDRMAKAEVEIIAAHYGLKKKGTAPPSPPPTSGSYLVKVTADVLNIRAGAGTGYKVVGQIRKNEVYTIVETKGNWGKLKSGVGWICLSYTVKK